MAEGKVERESEKEKANMEASRKTRVLTLMLADHKIYLRWLTLWREDRKLRNAENGVKSEV